MFNSDLGDRIMVRMKADGLQASHRALKDWPRGRCTPRLRVLLVRDCRCAGGLCACSGAAHALEVRSV